MAKDIYDPRIEKNAEPKTMGQQNADICTWILSMSLANNVETKN